MLNIQKWKEGLIVTAVFVAGIVVLSRCGNNTSTNSAASGTFTNVWQTMIQPTCQTCHTPGGSAATTCPLIKIDFTSQTTAYNTLVGTGGVSAAVACADVMPGCNGVLLVSPGAPTSSYSEYLVGDTSITGSPKAGCTPYAHSVLVPGIAASTLTSFKNWITNNAANN